MMAPHQTNDRSLPASMQRWKALLFISLSVLVISLDNTILNVALPSIARQLGASASALQWIVDAYILVFASLLLTMGAIGDRLGRKRTLQAGLALFGLGSLTAALAPSTAALIAARAFLGVGGAAILPGTLSIIAATFRDPRERTKAVGIWSAVFGLGVGLGPLIGGWLLTRFAWSAVFYVNLPVVAVALLGGQAFIAESRDAATRRLDIPGVLLSIPGLFALLYGIIEAGTTGWTHPSVVLALGAAAALLGMFAAWERRASSAMLPLRFFANRSFGGANLALILIMFANSGTVFILSPYFQSVQGYSALTTGLLLLPTAILVTIGSALSARLSGRFGVKMTVGGGIVLAAMGLLALAQVAAVDTAYITLFPSLALFALGLGVAIPAATSSVLGAVPVDRAGVGSGMNDTTRLLGSALGVAVLGTILNAVYTRQVVQLRSAPALATLPSEAVAGIGSSIQAAHLLAQQTTTPDVARVIIDTANQAFVAGMASAILAGAAMLLLAAAVTFLIVPAQVQRIGASAAPAPVHTSSAPAGELGN